MATSVLEAVRSRHSVAAAITLFFVAPFVAEYLLGDISAKLLPLLIVQAPMYGGGTLLIREFARRTRRGWSTMLCLGAAYALIEEGFVTQSLFNPNFLGAHFLQYAHVNWLGIGGWWTVLALNVHVFWSIGVSIALAEGLWPDRTKEPWLGAWGEMTVAVLFLVGLTINWRIGFRQSGFVASHLQFAVVGVVCLLLIVSAFAVPRRQERKMAAAPPSPWIMGAIAFVLGFVVLVTSPRVGWGAVAILLGVDAAFLAMVWMISRSSRWTPLHILSLGAGGALVYGVHAFLQIPAVGGGGVLARVGNVVFLIIAVVLVWLAAKRTARRSAALSGAR